MNTSQLVKKLFFKIIFLLSISFHAQAQIDMDKIITDKLNLTSRLQFKQDWYFLGLHIVTTAHVKNIDYTIDGGEVIVKTDSTIFLPISYEYSAYSNQNTTSIRRTWNEVIEYKITQGAIINLSKSITSSKVNAITLGFKIPIPGLLSSNPVAPAPEISGSSTTTVSFSTTDNQSLQKSLVVEETRRKTINFDVDPCRILKVVFRTTKFQLRVPFEAKLFVDGYVTVENITHSSGFSDGATNTVREEERIPLSTLLQPNDRKFMIRGYIENSKAIEESATNTERSLNPDSCLEVSPTTLSALYTDVAQHNKSLNKKLTKIKVNSLLTSKATTRTYLENGKQESIDLNAVKQLKFTNSTNTTSKP